MVTLFVSGQNTSLIYQYKCHIETMISLYKIKVLIFTVISSFWPMPLVEKHYSDTLCCDTFCVTLWMAVLILV